MTFDARTEANVIHRYMVAAAKQEFSGTGVEFLERYGFNLGIDGFACGIDGQIVCRLKRLDDNGRSSTFLTPRARKIQKNDPEIEGIPPGATVVDVGYVFNQLHTGYRDVQVIRVVDAAFVMSVPRADNQSISMPLPLFGSSGAGGVDRRFSILNRVELNSSDDSES